MSRLGSTSSPRHTAASSPRRSSSRRPRSRGSGNRRTEPPRLLHGDFRPANLLVGSRGSLRIIDFQDLVLGLPVQDIAITASALLARPHGRGLLEAFQGGYSTIRAWPAVERPMLDALMLGRRLHQLNLGLTLRGAGLDAMIDRIAAEVRAFFAAGGRRAG